jgi:hypothetical protein
MQNKHVHLYVGFSLTCEVQEHAHGGHVDVSLALRIVAGCIRLRGERLTVMGLS